jgi:hypothetical protein
MEVSMTKVNTCIILSASAVILFTAGNQNLSGKWEVQVEGYGAPRTQKFDFKQKGEGLSSVYAGKFGESKVSGTVKGSTADFEMRVIEDCHILMVHYTGVAAEDGIKGTVTFGDAGRATWVASRGTSGRKK